MNRVIFVDDDVILLDGLRGRLHGLRSRWQMVFVESGARAIAEMEHCAADVIVSDIRMPGMDGVELLETVRERWPDAIRIILSGYGEEQQSARLLSLVHQCLNKPCEAQQIEQVVGRCMELRDVLREPRLRAVVGRIAHLPAMPRTCLRLREAMAAPAPAVRDISRIIYDDPAVAAKVLQVVNSAFFRLARRMTNIEQAVGYLGFNAIRTLVLSVEISSAWRNDAAACAELNPQCLQSRAQRVAAAARALATGTSIADDALLAGLLHNIGYWVLMRECPQQLNRALEIARAQGIPLHAAEREAIGASHAEIGAYLLGLWGLPYPVIEAVAFQHCPQRISQTHFDVLAALVIAQSLSVADSSMIPGVIERADVIIGAEYLQSLQPPFGWAEAQQRVAEASGDLH